MSASFNYVQNAETPFRQRFFRDHGECVRLDPYWLLFEDGFKLAGDGDPTNLHWEPPPDSPVERLKLKLRFFEVKQRIARDKFKTLKLRVRGTFTDEIPAEGFEPYMGTEEEALAELEEAHAAVRHADYVKQNVERELTIAIEGADFETVRRERRWAEAERAAKKKDFANRLKEFKV